jgi:hypothetical protein
MKREFTSNQARRKPAMNKIAIVTTGLVLFFSLLISACGHKGDPHPPADEDGVKAPKSKRYGS